jgi:hypothetical protein
VEPNRAQLIALAKLVDGGQLRVVIDSTFTLAEAAAAFERSLASGKHGKVVIEWPMTRTLHIERPSRSDQAPGGELGGNHAMVTPDQMYAMPSQQEGQLDDALITKLLTNWSGQSRSTADAGGQSPASATVHHTGRLSMAWKRSGVRVP